MSSSTYASAALPSALISSVHVRKARSHKPRASSERTIHSFERGADVLPRIFAKKARATEYSCCPMAASPSLCHACSWLASSRSGASSLAAAASTVLARSSVAAAFAYSPSSTYARAMRRWALTRVGSSATAAAQSAIASLYELRAKCVAARLRRYLGTDGAFAIALLYSVSASVYTRCSNLDLAAVLRASACCSDWLVALAAPDTGDRALEGVEPRGGAFGMATSSLGAWCDVDDVMCDISSE